MPTAMYGLCAGRLRPDKRMQPMALGVIVKRRRVKPIVGRTGVQNIANREEICSSDSRPVAQVARRAS